ncbi:hypothetical protein AVEN_39354-1, partial [Araneus ventricosus]
MCKTSQNWDGMEQKVGHLKLGIHEKARLCHLSQELVCVPLIPVYNF